MRDMAPRGASRQAAIAAAAELMQRQGYAATGLEEVLATSGSPKGSFYFHFPAGKEQLAAEALTHGGAAVRAFVEQVAASAATPGDAVRAIAAVHARQLSRSNFELGCPIATVTLEMASRSDPIREAADGAFTSWSEPLAALLEAHGHARAAARQLATWAIAGLEGALVLARAARDATVVTKSAAVSAALLDLPADELDKTISPVPDARRPTTRRSSERAASAARRPRSPAG
jgi:TetR/AcrR family transcriptional repressor of lmrAB and yxaGH operons